MNELLEYTNQTNLHPLGAIAVVVLGAAMLVLPRRFATAPFALMACFISPAQRVVFFELDFDLLRIMVIFATVRVLLHGEYRRLVWRPLDTALLLWGVSATITYTMLYGSVGALVNRLGLMFEAVGMYFVFRCLIRDWADFRCFITTLAVASIPVSLAFILERASGYNSFSVFGRVPAYTLARQGRLRCQGPFPHPIIAGCFWAALLPLIVSLWWLDRGRRYLAVTGATCSLVIIALTASSTPVGAVAMACVGAAMFPFRYAMRTVRWSLAALLIALHLAMNGPVWSLFAKADLVAGSTGYHRFNVIDKAIHHFSEWWLIGTRSTAHWGYWLFDVTNQYVLQGVRGGLVTLLLFVAILALTYRDIGRLVQSAAGDPRAQKMAWALGVALFVHTINFFGVSYFGQISLTLYSLLAAAASLAPVRQPACVPTAPALARMPAPTAA